MNDKYIYSNQELIKRITCTTYLYDLFILGPTRVRKLVCVTLTASKSGVPS